MTSLDQNSLLCLSGGEGHIAVRQEISNCEHALHMGISTDKMTKFRKYACSLPKQTFCLNPNISREYQEE